MEQIRQLSPGPFVPAFHLPTLGVKIGGANEEAEKAYMFGLDYLRLEKVTAQD